MVKPSYPIDSLCINQKSEQQAFEELVILKLHDLKAVDEEKT